MKYNRELKGWEKLLTRFKIPYIKFVYSRDAFDDWRIEIYRAYWRFRPKNYRTLDEYWAEILESNIRFWERVRRSASGASDLDRYDQETGAHLRRSPRGIVHIESAERNVSEYIQRARHEQAQIERIAREVGAHIYGGPITNRDLGDEA